MTTSKIPPKIEPVDAPLEEAKDIPADDLVDIPEVEVPVGVPVKKPLGVKEVIPFEWKLVGGADGVVLTLYKAVERADVEAQLERVQKEGYYTDLRILEAAAKVEQSKSFKPLKATEPRGRLAPKPEPSRTFKSDKRTKAAAAPPSRIAATPPSRIAATPPSRPATKKPTIKRAVKVAPKKSAATKSSKKPATKKK